MQYARRSDPQMHFACSRLSAELYERRGCRTSDNGIIDEYNASSFEGLSQGAELERDALAPQCLCRLDEGAPDIAVFYKPFAEWNAGLPRISDRGRNRRIRHRNNNISRGRRFLRENLTQPTPDRMDILSIPD
jgi:hypothetical protein